MRLVPGHEPIPGYILVEPLGRGSYGEVWKVRGPGGTPLALKIVDLQSGTDLREFRSLLYLRHIRHPHLLPVIGFWTLDYEGHTLDLAELESKHAAGNADQGTVGPRQLLVAMVLGEKNLEQRLAECRQAGDEGIAVEELLTYMEDAAKGIDYLNAPIHTIDGSTLAIQHRDIKPANIVLLGGTAVICDFGVARALEAHSMTASAVVGSPAFMAPESIEAKRTGPAADQYSLAITYFRLRTGQLPFPPDASAVTIIHCHISGSLNLDALPPAERDVVARATAVDPHQRFDSCREFAESLRSAIAGDTPTDGVRRGGAHTPSPVIPDTVRERGQSGGKSAAFRKHRPRHGSASPAQTSRVRRWQVGAALRLLAASVGGWQLWHAEPVGPPLVREDDDQDQPAESSGQVSLSPGETEQRGDAEERRDGAPAPSTAASSTTADGGTAGQGTEQLEVREGEATPSPGENLASPPSLPRKDDEDSGEESTAPPGDLAGSDVVTKQADSAEDKDDSTANSSRGAQQQDDAASPSVTPAPGASPSELATDSANAPDKASAEDAPQEQPARRDDAPDATSPAPEQVVQDPPQPVESQTISPRPSENAATTPEAPATPERAARLGDSFTNSLGMQLVRVRPGQFNMGSRYPAQYIAQTFEGELATSFVNEHPRHRVRITKPFYVARHEVTNEQFGEFARATGYQTDAERDPSVGAIANPNSGEKLNEEESSATNWRLMRDAWREMARRNGWKGSSADVPVIMVSWNDAMSFCDWLSRKEGRRYRLPTEAEWEYFCRAGTETLFWTGDKPITLAQGANVPDKTMREATPNVEYPTLSVSDGYPNLAPVGSYRPNAFGIYDTHGNVWEWCLDYYADDFYGRSPVDDPLCLAGSQGHVNRGGCCY